MSLFKQTVLDIDDEIIVDLFAGGGGASVGIEMALGRMVDIAVNHNARAVAMHQANHPNTLHLQSDVFEVDPREVTDGRPVGLLWASPDCTYHSKARGGKPLREAGKKRRALAWVVTRWAAQVRPRVICLENVEEFAQWGPLVGPKDMLRPCKRRRGKTFKAWVRSLEREGYAVEWRELVAADYGTPTIRKRLYVIARCDGLPIVWPERTHGKDLKPYRTTAECIDWSVPMLSVFATKDGARLFAKHFGLKGTPIRPLADESMRRIARGVQKFVVDNPGRYLLPMDQGFAGCLQMPITHGGAHRMAFDAEKPLQTITSRGETAVVAPFMVPYHKSEGPRGQNLDEPLATVDTANRHAVIGTFLSQYRSGFASGNSGDGRSVDEPNSTISTKGPHQALGVAFMTQNNKGATARDVDAPTSTILTESRGHHGLCAAMISHAYTSNVCGGEGAVDKPAKTIVAGGTHASLVAAMMTKFYGTATGQAVDEPAHTITAKDRLGLVTVKIKRVTYVIEDIFMRMLTPAELYACQGFPKGYVFDRDADGNPLTKTEQVQMCGNSVCPPVARAIIGANCGWLKVRGDKELEAVA